MSSKASLKRCCSGIAKQSMNCSSIYNPCAIKIVKTRMNSPPARLSDKDLS